MKKTFKKALAFIMMFAICFSAMSFFSAVDADAKVSAPQISPYIYLHATKEPVKMAGVTYNDGILFRMGYNGLSNGYTGEVNYNFRGDYSLLTFYAGFVKGAQRDANFTVFADGKEIVNETLRYTGIAKLYKIDLTGVSRVTIRFFTNGYDGAYYGIGGIQMYSENQISEDSSPLKSKHTCNPYLYTNAQKINGDFNMGGYKYRDGFDMNMGYKGNSTTGKSEIIFNFEGKYNFISFDFGRYENDAKVDYDRDCYLKITADGKVLHEVTVKWNDIPQFFDIDLTGISQLSIYAESQGYDTVHYRLANVQINPTRYEVVDRVFYSNLDYYTQHTSSTSYNPTLANIMAALSKAVYYEGDIKSACESLGFESYGVYDYYSNYNPQTCGYSLALKKSDYSDDIICLVSIRGSQSLDYNADWIGNLELITDDNKHIGFSYPANRIYETIQKVLGDKGLNVKYFITGHSRGAAVANLLSVKLMENGVSESDIYNYNFACPDVTYDSYIKSYDNIFNLCNRNDIVPYVPNTIVDPLIMAANPLTPIKRFWGKFGKTYWFDKDAPDTRNPLANHDMSLYLEFFDQKLALTEWKYSFTDALSDATHKVFGWVAKFNCPVDFEIVDKNGNKIASVIGGKINYYDSQIGDVIIFTDGDKKGVFVKGDREFNINMLGTDTGKMTYSIEKCELKTGEIFESKLFENVNLKKGKTMYSPVSEAESTEDIGLFVTENVNGETQYTYIINEDGTEKKYNYIPDCTISIANNPGNKKINFGDKLKLTATYENSPECSVVCWYVDGVMQGTGDTFELTFESGAKTVEVRLTDSDGNPYTDVKGSDIVDSEKITINAGFFQKLISFFKNLFGINRTIVQ